ncbi:unnamed protein product [Adineta steineri]|uniref:Uncharacterized protein n=1 Tax=Adineta steineri TaxID=433720 RepID=A0A813X1N9_9BILA|nr:unnamed protein product [Adineta steineri]CAF3656229.1 unnamed protein product [Adineta steineri]
MPVTSFVKPTTPINTAPPSNTTNGTNTTTTATAVQSGPYTKAQFLNTMEGSRSVKNIKEIETLLKDYPAALELYRTKKYKVKVKYEADVERVILVEKRSSKNASNNAIKTNDIQSNKQSIPDLANDVNKTKEDVKKVKDVEQPRSRPHSKDRIMPATSATENNDLVQTTATSSNHMISNTTQPKVDQQRISSKEREPLASSHSKPDQQSSSIRDRSHDSRSNGSHMKHKGRKSSRDYPTALVPYVPNANPAANMWPQSRALQPYYNNPMFQRQQYQSNYFMPSSIIPQQNPMYQQPYYYPQRTAYPLVYQQQSMYQTTPQLKSAGNITNQPIHTAHHYHASSRTMYNAHRGAALPPSFHTFHPAHQHYQTPQAVTYQPQMPAQWPAQWPAAAVAPQPGPVGPVMNNNPHAHLDARRNSKNRAHSVDTGHRGTYPLQNYIHPQQQQHVAAAAAAVIEQHHHHHHHHRHHPQHPQHPQRPHVVDVSAKIVAPTIEIPKQAYPQPPPPPQQQQQQQHQQQHVPSKDATAPVNFDNYGEKLTIRQLNEIFIQMDQSGRLPYNTIPAILQRFSIALTENDLLSAAQELKYNVAEPISARRLVHVLVKLGKIAKSNNQQKLQQQQSLGSPSMLPEDREVTDIMTQQRRAAGAASTHIHSSVYPNYWY